MISVSQVELHEVNGSFSEFAVRTCKRLELDPDVVEPIIIAVMQDRLTSPEAVGCCALLVERCMLKVSYRPPE